MIENCAKKIQYIDSHQQIY